MSAEQLGPRRVWGLYGNGFAHLPRAKACTPTDIAGKESQYLHPPGLGNLAGGGVGKCLPPAA